MNKKCMISLVSFGLCAVIASAGGLQTKYGNNTGGNTTNLHAAADGQLVVKSLYAKCAGAAEAAIAAYGRTGSPATAISNGTVTTVVYLSNTGTNLAINDLVAYQLVNGTVGIVAITSATETAIGILPAVTVANTTKFYELSQIAAWTIGTTAYNADGDAIIATPVDSPLLIVTTATNTSATLTSTVAR